MGLFKKLAGVAGTAIGSYFGGPLGSKIGGAIGSSLGGGGGGGGGGGSGTSATAGGFVPYGITTGYGSSSIDPTAHTATYNLTPDMAARRDAFYAASKGAMPNQTQLDFANSNINTARGLFDNASSMDLNQMTSDYYNQQQDILQPGRDLESSRLNDLMFSRGTIGAGVGVAGGGYVNPQQYAAQMARENENSRLLMGAEDRVRGIQGDMFTQANSLYGLGQDYLTQPYDTANKLFGYGTGIENLGMDTMTTGMNVGLGVQASNQKSIGLNADINQQNYLNGLRASTASNNTWSDIFKTASDTNWGGLFGNNQGYDMLPDTGGDYWQASA